MTLGAGTERSRTIRSETTSTIMVSASPFVLPASCEKPRRCPETESADCPRDLCGPLSVCFQLGMAGPLPMWRPGTQLSLFGSGCVPKALGNAPRLPLTVQSRLWASSFRHPLCVNPLPVFRRLIAVVQFPRQLGLAVPFRFNRLTDSRRRGIKCGKDTEVRQNMIASPTMATTGVGETPGSAVYRIPPTGHPPAAGRNSGLDSRAAVR